MRAVFICYCRSRTFELDHVSKGLIRYIYALILSYILLTGHEHVLHLRHHIMYFICISIKKRKVGNLSDSTGSLVPTTIELLKFHCELPKV